MATTQNDKQYLVYLTYFFFMFRFIGVIFQGLPLFFALNSQVLPLFCKFLKSFFHAETVAIIDFHK